MQKEEVLDAIRRGAEANGGTPLGRERFERETGVWEHMWAGRFWTRWSEAVAEAGYAPQTMNAALPDDVVWTRLAELARTLGRYPTIAEISMKRREDPSFPDYGVYRKYGGKGGAERRLVEYLGDHPEWADVIDIAFPIASEAEEPIPEGNQPQAGEVYLMKSGAHYKIGRSNASGRRAYELAIQLLGDSVARAT